MSPEDLDPPGYDVVAGKLTRRFRAIALLLLVVFAVDSYRVEGNVELQMLGSGVVLLGGATLVSLLASRRPHHPWAGRAVEVELALDAVYAVTDAAFGIAVIGYVAIGVPALLVPIEAAFRKGTRGGAVVGAVIGGAIAVARLLLPDTFLVAPVRPADIAPLLLAPPLLGVVLGRVVTSRQKLIDQLASTNADLTEALRWQQDLLSFAAHEVKAPLTGTVGAIGLLGADRGAMSDETRAELLAMAERNAMRAADTADDLLGRARVAAGALTPTVVPTDVSELVSKLCDHARQEGLEVHTEIVPSLVLRTDPSFIRHVVTNLLSNSRKYGAPPVEVALWNERDQVVLRVRDHGPGVPSDFRDVMFDSFTRAGGTSAEGTGVGLHVVRRMVRALGGTVAYEPAEPHGATFVVRLPDRAR